MTSNLMNANLYYISLYIAQLGTEVRRSILAIIISGAAMPYSALCGLNTPKLKNFWMHMPNTIIHHSALLYIPQTY